MNRKAVSIAIMFALVLSGWVGSAPAQEGSGGDLIIPGNPGDVSTGPPRDSVRGGALAERRPGLRVQAAITRHVNYQRTSLHDYGGGEPGGDEEVSPYADLLVQFINAIFDALDAVFAQLLLGPIDNSSAAQKSTVEG